MATPAEIHKPTPEEASSVGSSTDQSSKPDKTGFYLPMTRGQFVVSTLGVATFLLALGIEIGGNKQDSPVPASQSPAPSTKETSGKEIDSPQIGDLLKPATANKDGVDYEVAVDQKDTRTVDVRVRHAIEGTLITLVSNVPSTDGTQPDVIQTKYYPLFSAAVISNETFLNETVDPNDPKPITGIPEIGEEFAATSYVNVNGKPEKRIQTKRWRVKDPKNPNDRSKDVASGKWIVFTGAADGIKRHMPLLDTQTTQIGDKKIDPDKVSDIV